MFDHLTVIAELKSDLHRHTAKKHITYRRINQVDINKFKTDISKSQLITNPKLSADSLYQQFHDTLSSILNTHAPLKTKSVSPKPPNPWITSAITITPAHDDILNASYRNLTFNQIDQNILSKLNCVIERWRELGENILEIIVMKMRMTLENVGGRSTWYYTEFLLNQCLPQLISPHFATVSPPFFVNKI